ncbi:hypothetical protein [Flavobacterium sp. RS13.1]|uniref:hypothetical protein n=1 Tax=Flavobacterium sp. RS13.1 TaxID=3400345 RepID=UPI003AAA5C2A
MKNRLIGFRKILMYFYIISLFISCKREQIKNEKVELLENIVKVNLGRKLVIPKDLQLYTPFSQNSTDSAKIANSSLKLYSYVNTSCSTCLDEIKEWNSFALKLKKYKTPIILVCKTRDNFELLKYLCETKKIKTFDYPFFLDIKEHYINKNPFMNASSDFETVLTDRNNSILLIGNPLHSEIIKQLYLSKIQKDQGEVKIQ